MYVVSKLGGKLGKPLGARAMKHHRRATSMQRTRNGCAYASTGAGDKCRVA